MTSYSPSALPVIPAPDAIDASRRGSTRLYVVLLAVLSLAVLFPGLGADSLSNDEAQYALCVQNIKKSGDWVHISPYPPTPYFQKPPLYFWLTAATYDVLDRIAEPLFGGHEAVYRFWSAAFGVACVALTALLGARMFSPEVGFLAGLLLLTNRAFVIQHGARSGTFDALLTCFALACVYLYWAMVTRRRSRWLGWLLIGVLVGLASLTKPLHGLVTLGLLALHAVAIDREARWPWRVLGPLLALIIGLAIVAPWNYAQYQRHPDVYLQETFGSNLVERVTVGITDLHRRSWSYYLGKLTRSSPPFVLALPALVFVVVRAVKTKWRGAYSLIALVAAGWVLLLSLSASKLQHYLYPALPLVAIAIADMAAAAARALAPSVAREFGESGDLRRRRVLAVCLAAAAVTLGFLCARMAYHVIPGARTTYLPWEMYRTFAPAIDDGRMRIVFSGFPREQVEWRGQMMLKARDCYYLEQMRASPRAIWLDDAGAAADVLKAPTPTLLLLSVLAGGGGHDLTRLIERSDRRFAYEHAGFTISAVDAGTLLEPAWSSTTPNPYLKPAGPAFDAGRVVAEVTPPLVEEATLVVTLYVAAPAGGEVARQVHCVARLGRKRILEGDVPVIAGRAKLVATIERDDWVGAGPHTLTIDLSTTERVILTELRLTVRPPVPIERQSPY